MDLGLQGKHAIVTGGSRGIGKAIARELAREGADVAIVARNKETLEATARELAAETNRRILPLAADVTSKEQVDRMVAEAAQQLGGLHILVNSGSAPGGSATATGPIETVVDEDLIEDFNVKYVGALRCSRAVIPFMKTAGWGRIINISGGNARNAGNLSGGARNAGLVHMTKTLAVQLGRHGITVNCIHPGTTRTERTPSLIAARAAQLGVSPEEAERRDFAPDSPRGNSICRMVDASEVAFVAVFLASEKAWAVSGELVAAGGGAGRSVYYWSRQIGRRSGVSAKPAAQIRPGGAGPGGIWLPFQSAPRTGWSTARASAQNSTTDSSSARAVGAMAAWASRDSTGTPRVLRLERSILRRWPNAAAVTRSRTGLEAAAKGLARGARRTTLEVTLGGGTKARGGRSKRILGSVSHCTRIDSRP